MILRRWKVYLPAAVLGLIVVWLVLYPLGRLVDTAFSGSAGVAVDSIRSMFDSAATKTAIVGSLVVTGLSLVIAVPLGVALAWITSSTDAHLGKRLASLPIIALAVNPLTSAIGWLILLEPRAGIVNELIRSTFHMKSLTGPFNAHSLWVIVLVMGLLAVPYVYGPAYGAFTKMDASIEEAGRITGAGKFRLLFTITFPVIKPAILAGSLIAGILLISTFSVPYILESGTSYQVIPTLIYYDISAQDLVAPGTALAGLLAIPTIIAVVFYGQQIKSGRFTTIGGKGGRSVHVELGPWRWPATILLVLFVLFALVVPILALIYLSLIGYWGSDVFKEPFSFANYHTLLSYPHAISSLWNSVWLSALAGLLALLLGFGVSYLQHTTPSIISRTASFLCSIPLGIPGVVLGVAFLYAFTGHPFPLYETPFLIIIAYWAHVLPISLRNSDAALRQVAPELSEAARISGDSTFGAVFRVVMPLIRGPLITTWGLTFIILFRDLPVSIFVYGASTTPSSVTLFSIYNEGLISLVAAYSVIMTIVSGLVVWLVLARGSSVDAEITS